jgi:hypothetical protein
MPLTSREEPVRIQLPAEGEWVDVKPRLSKADERAVFKRLLGDTEISPLRAIEFDGKPEAEVAAELLGEVRMNAAELIEEMTWAGLEQALVAWSFYEGKPQPADIRDLDQESFDVIVARLNELYPGARSDDDRKNSASNGLTPSSEGAESPAISPG